MTFVTRDPDSTFREHGQIRHSKTKSLCRAPAMWLQSTRFILFCSKRYFPITSWFSAVRLLLDSCQHTDFFRCSCRLGFEYELMRLSKYMHICLNDVDSSLLCGGDISPKPKLRVIVIHTRGCAGTFVICAGLGGQMRRGTGRAYLRGV